MAKIITCWSDGQYWWMPVNEDKLSVEVPDQLIKEWEETGRLIQKMQRQIRYYDDLLNYPEDAKNNDPKDFNIPDEFSK